GEHPPPPPWFFRRRTMTLKNAHFAVFLIALAVGCSSRQAPAEFPAGSAASPQTPPGPLLVPVELAAAGQSVGTSSHDHASLNTGHDHTGHDHTGHDHTGHDHTGHDHAGHGDNGPEPAARYAC